jgi:signal transduction histidine kinase
LQAADRRKDQFLAVLAHELRNLLAPIGYAVDLMQMSAEDPATVRECSSAADRQLRQMTRLVDDLLDVSRIARGKMELRCGCVSLITAAASAVEISRPWIEQNEQTLHVAVPAEPVEVYADTTRLTQVIANLLNNASKYSPMGGEIRLTVDRDGTDAVIRVKDNGIGVPASELPQVFDMYSQFEPAPRQTLGGLGIGLGLAKAIVELHAGSITARSDGPQQGSEFVVRLPCVSGSTDDTDVVRGSGAPR